MLTGCKTIEGKASQNNPAGAAATMPGQYTRVEQPDNSPARWWDGFGSVELSALVDRAMAGNRTLAASNATLEQAREHVTAVAGRRLPQVDVNGRAQHEKFNLSIFGLDSSSAGAGGLGNPVFDLYSVGGGISYDLDLFGGNRRAVEHVAAEAEAQQFQTEAAHLAIAGRVVNQVLVIASLNDRMKIANVLLDEDRRNVIMTQQRQQWGVGTLVDVMGAQQQLAADNADVPKLEQNLVEARSILAVLIGVSPAELGPTDFSLEHLTLPRNIPVTLPSELVHKRPDILETEARLHAATAAIGVATARLYPDITLGATLTQSTTDPANILSSRFRAFDIFSALTAPIFHGGTLKAEKRGAEAGARAAAANYQQAVLVAFGQVSDLLAALDNDSHSVATQQESANLAARSLEMSRKSFTVGNVNMLQVLDASRTNQRAKMALLDAATQQFLDVSRLFVATAGGWTGPSKTATATP